MPEKFSNLEIGDIFTRNNYDPRFKWFIKLSAGKMRGYSFTNKKHKSFSIDENEDVYVTIRKKHPAYDKAVEFPIILQRSAFRWLDTTQKVLSYYRSTERDMDGFKVYITHDQTIPTDFESSQQVDLYLELKKLYKLMVDHDTPKHLRKLTVHLKAYFQINFSVSQWFVPCGAKNIRRRSDDYDHVTCKQCKKKVQEFRHNIIHKEPS